MAEIVEARARLEASRKSTKMNTKVCDELEAEIERLAEEIVVTEKAYTQAEDELEQERERQMKWERALEDADAELEAKRARAKMAEDEARRLRLRNNELKAAVEQRALEMGLLDAKLRDLQSEIDADDMAVKLMGTMVRGTREVEMMNVRARLYDSNPNYKGAQHEYEPCGGPAASRIVLKTSIQNLGIEEQESVRETPPRAITVRPPGAEGPKCGYKGPRRSCPATTRSGIESNVEKGLGTLAEGLVCWNPSAH
eukprot:TRINITY_DN28771_c0_g1_i1.p1 TRINITY_DN28771_c0_g1~~TRINITY_DN28771_c0_g1_i1.p1  ORF type:complete len:255 (-),score=69.60 TRINITY_DN28771_c0_g1_i1:120-884(-)